MIENYGVYLLMMGTPLVILAGLLVFLMERSARREREMEKDV